MALKFVRQVKAGDKEEGRKNGLCCCRGTHRSSELGELPNTGVHRGCLYFVLFFIKQYLKRIVKL